MHEPQDVSAVSQFGLFSSLKVDDIHTIFNVFFTPHWHCKEQIEKCSCVYKKASIMVRIPPSLLSFPFFFTIKKMA